MPSWDQFDMLDGKPILFQDQFSDCASFYEIENAWHHDWIPVYPITPTKPRPVQIIKQVPLSRGRARHAPVQDQERRMKHKSKMLVEEGLSNQQTGNGCQEKPFMTINAPITDLKPLAFLNDYRRNFGREWGLEPGLDLGPSKNLMSSELYNYDPVPTQAFYENLDRMTSGHSRSQSMQEVREEFNQEVTKLVASISNVLRPSPRCPQFYEDPFLSKARDLPLDIFWSRQSRFFPKDRDDNSSSNLSSQHHISHDGSIDN